MSERKTVRVRIAVAVDEDGEWDCADEARLAVLFLCDEQLFDSEAKHHVVWIEADVPIPTTETIEGTVDPEPQEEGL